VPAVGDVSLPRARVKEVGEFQADGVITVSLGHAVHDTYTAFLPPLLPAFIANLALSKTEAGLLSVFSQGPSLLQPFIGGLADRVNLRWMVILAPALTAVMMSLLGIAPSYVVLALFLTVTGLSSAGFHAVAPVMAGHLSGRRLGRGMSFMMVGGELGRTIGPLIIVGAVKLWSLEGTPWLMIGGLLASALLYLRLRDVPVQPPRAGPSFPWRQALRGLGPFLALLGGIIAVRSLMVAALTTYLPIYLSEEGADLWFAGVSLSVLQAAGVMGALAGGSLSDRLGRRLILLLVFLTTPFLMFVLLATDGWARLALLLALGFLVLAVPPVLMALAQESCPESRALANGLYMALNFVIQSVAAVAVGTMGDAFGMRPAFAVSAALPLLGLPLVLLLPRKRVGSAESPTQPGASSETTHSVKGA
jgi:FSR family fosmidomycin resistance protein-like MFS transporter